MDHLAEGVSVCVCGGRQPAKALVARRRSVWDAGTLSTGCAEEKGEGQRAWQGVLGLLWYTLITADG